MNGTHRDASEGEGRSSAKLRNGAAQGTGRAEVAFPILRWVALGWLLVWTPVYWRAWGWQNFFHLCDIAVILSCLGIIAGNRLLISSQCVAAIVPQAIWCFEICWRLATGRVFFGGAEYMWDPSVPVFVRTLSLFHVALPIVLIYAVARTGYDRRGLSLQIAIAGATLVISRAFGPTLNLNYAFVEPLFHRTWGPAAVHLAAVLAFISTVFYLPVHLMLAKFFARTGNQ
jgi:hypothetical protein